MKELERRIKDGTDSLISELRLPLTEERRILWENALEIFRCRAGTELSPLEAFELMVAEVIAEWSHATNPEVAEAETTDTKDEPTEAPPPDDEARPLKEPGDDAETEATEASPIFPWAEEVDTSRVEQGSLWSTWTTEREAEDDSEHLERRTRSAGVDARPGAHAGARASAGRGMGPISCSELRPTVPSSNDLIRRHRSVVFTIPSPSA